MLSNDTHFNLIHIDSPTEEIVKRLEGDTQKKRSKGYIENIDYVRKEDKIAFEEIKSNFLNLGFNLSHFYLFNSRDADIRRELETIVTEDEADKR